MRYASETTVPVERTRQEIEDTLQKYGATAFHHGWESGRAMVAFRLKDLFIRFVLPFPDRTAQDITHKLVKQSRSKRWVARTEGQVEATYQQHLRQRWRALLLTVKAKLEAVECGISTVEQEFLAFIVLPGEQGATVGDYIIEQALPQIRGGHMPKSLLGPAAGGGP